MKDRLIPSKKATLDFLESYVEHQEKHGIIVMDRLSGIIEPKDLHELKRYISVMKKNDVLNDPDKSCRPRIQENFSIEKDSLSDLMETAFLQKMPEELITRYFHMLVPELEKPLSAEERQEIRDTYEIPTKVQYPC
ncbi:hypothetical protein ACFL1H_00395 [Nanoarchaeota archaeon]